MRMSRVEDAEFISPLDNIAYSSAYTMHDTNGTVIVHQDTMRFMVHGTRNQLVTNIIGQSRPDINGQQMILALRQEEEKLAGTWQECSSDSGLVSDWGHVEFVRNDTDGRYFGYWSTSYEGRVTDAGTWALAPQVGSIALVSSETLVQTS